MLSTGASHALALPVQNVGLGHGGVNIIVFKKPQRKSGFATDLMLVGVIFRPIRVPDNILL